MYTLKPMQIFEGDKTLAHTKTVDKTETANHLAKRFDT